MTQRLWILLSLVLDGDMPARIENSLDSALLEELKGLTPREIVTTLCEARTTPMVPEIRTYLSSEAHRFWRQGEEAMQSYPFGMPFWGIPWAGGLGLARWIIDNPQVVSGKSVWCFAAGAGIEAIAARHAGAADVTVNDIDPVACAAAKLNAELNAVVVQTSDSDKVGDSLDGVDVLLAGDFCYDEELSERVFSWLEQLLDAGIEVYVGDPGRVFLQKERLHTVWRGKAEPGHDYDDPDVRRAGVFRFL